MEKKLDLSVILPIKSSIVRDFDEYFEKAIKSLQIQKVHGFLFLNLMMNMQIFGLIMF